MVVCPVLVPRPDHDPTLPLSLGPALDRPTTAPQHGLTRFYTTAGQWGLRHRGQQPGGISSRLTQEPPPQIQPQSIPQILLWLSITPTPPCRLPSHGHCGYRVLVPHILFLLTPCRQLGHFTKGTTEAQKETLPRTVQREHNEHLPRQGRQTHVWGHRALSQFLQQSEQIKSPVTFSMQSALCDLGQQNSSRTPALEKRGWLGLRWALWSQVGGV